MHSGSGSAGLDLSQKGDLPSSGEAGFRLVQGRRRALREARPVGQNQGLPRPWGRGAKTPSAGRILTSPTGAPRSRFKGVCVFWLFAREEPLRGPRQHSGWAVNDNRVGPILDRKLNVGFADRNPVHLAAMGALNLQCLLPGSGEAVWVGLDTGRGSSVGSGACEEQWRHVTLQGCLPLKR